MRSQKGHCSLVFRGYLAVEAHIPDLRQLHQEIVLKRRDHQDCVILKLDFQLALPPLDCPANYTFFLNGQLLIQSWYFNVYYKFFFKYFSIEPYTLFLSRFSCCLCFKCRCFIKPEIKCWWTRYSTTTMMVNNPTAYPAKVSNSVQIPERPALNKNVYGKILLKNKK